MRCRVTTRNRVTIPKPIRDLVGLRPGDEIDFIKRAGKVYLVPRDPEARKRLSALMYVVERWGGAPG